MKKIIYTIVLLAIIFGGVFYFNSKRVSDISKTEDETTISIQSVSDQNNDLTAAATLSNNKVVTWKTTGYPLDAGVNINLIRKTSDSPITYTLVRTIAQDTPNDGQEKWSLLEGEKSNDLYIEITCSNTYQYKQSCKISSGEPMKVK